MPALVSDICCCIYIKYLYYYKLPMIRAVWKLILRVLCIGFNGGKAWEDKLHMCYYLRAIHHVTWYMYASLTSYSRLSYKISQATLLPCISKCQVKFELYCTYVSYNSAWKLGFFESGHICVLRLLVSNAVTSRSVVVCWYSVVHLSS